MQMSFEPPTSRSITERPKLLAALAAEGQSLEDSFFSIRVVLLVAAGFAAGFGTFFLPWPITFLLLLAWTLVMMWP